MCWMADLMVNSAILSPVAIMGRSRVDQTVVIGAPMRARKTRPPPCRPISIGNMAWLNSFRVMPVMDFTSFNFTKRITAMTVKFIGYIGFNNSSETDTAKPSRALDRDYIEAAARAQEVGDFDRVLIPFGSNTPESQ